MRVGGVATNPDWPYHENYRIAVSGHDILVASRNAGLNVIDVSDWGLNINAGTGQVIPLNPRLTVRGDCVE